jgi:CheY-like chemotaxis protein
MINYNILWFEDVKSFYTVTKKRLEIKFKDTDLNLNFTLSKGKSIVNQIDSNSDIDLILMDHNLFQAKGDVLIRDIRKKKLLTEIIYYSQDADLKSNVTNVEGIFFSNKRNLYSITTKLIEKATRPINEVSIQRGSFISDVIKLESKLVEIILKYFLIEKTGKEQEFRIRIIESEFFSTYQKYRIIQSVLKEKLSAIKEKDSNKYKNLETLISIFKKFQKEVIEMRNKLAHVEETLVDGIAKFITTDGEEFEISEKGIKTARKKLKNHSNNLDELITHF